MIPKIIVYYVEEIMLDLLHLKLAMIYISELKHNKELNTVLYMMPQEIAVNAIEDLDL